MNLTKGPTHPEEDPCKLLECTFQTKDGIETRYVVAKGKEDAARSLIILGNVKHTLPYIHVVEVKMNKRMVL